MGKLMSRCSSNVLPISTTLFLSFSVQSVAAQDQFSQQNIDGVTYTIAMAPRQADLRIVSVETQGVVELLKSFDCSGFAITGGFTHEMKARSLLEVDGETISTIERRRGNDGAFIVTTEGGPVFVRYRERKSLEKLEGDKIQSYPVLIADDKVDLPLNDSRLGNRVGVGMTEEGRLVFAMAHNSDRQGTTATTTLAFARNVLELVGSRVEWFVNFDGGASAFLAAPENVVAPSNGFVSSYLCAE